DDAAASRAAPLEVPTHTGTGTSACVKSLSNAFMSVSRAPDALIWKTKSLEWSRAASFSDVRMRAALAGSMRPFTCTTSMRPASPAGSDVCARAAVAIMDRPDRAMKAMATSRSGRMYLSYHEGDGGSRFLLHLPRRHRRRQGRRREDHGNGHARGYCRAGRPIRPDRGSRGKIGAPGDVRHRTPGLRGDRLRSRHPGTVPHPGCRARRLPPDP